MFKFDNIIMITEDEKIFDIVKILRTKIDNREEDTNFTLLHRAKTPDDIFLDEELKFWQENDMLMVRLSVESPREDTVGKGGADENQQEGKFTNSIAIF
jgi:NAD(P)H-flavin reductase